MSGPSTGPPLNTARHARPTIVDRVRAVAPTVLLDLLLPYVVYLVLARVGVPVVAALTAGGLVPAIRALARWRRDRTVDVIAVAVAGLFLLGAVLSAVTGDPRLAVAKESLLTGAGGVFCLATLAMRRPAMFFVRERFSPYPTSAWDRAWTTSAALRRDLRMLTAVWGLGLVAEAAGLLVLVFSTPVETSATLAPLANVGVVALLVAVTHVYAFCTRRSLDAVAAARDAA